MAFCRRKANAFNCFSIIKYFKIASLVNAFEAVVQFFLESGFVMADAIYKAMGYGLATHGEREFKQMSQQLCLAQYGDFNSH